MGAVVEGMLEIVDRPRVNPWLLTVLIPVVVILGGGALFFDGLKATAEVLLPLLIAGGFCLFAHWHGGGCRVLLSDSGICLTSYRRGRQGVRSAEFKWSEVAEVRPMRPWAGTVLRIGRAQPFWTLRLQRSSIVVPRRIACNPLFIGAVQAHVPAERIRPNALNVGTPPSFRWPNRIGILYIAFSVATAYIAARAVGAERPSSFYELLLPSICAYGGAFLWMITANSELPEYSVIAATLWSIALVFVWFQAFCWAYGGPFILAAFLGTLAGMLLALGIVVFAKDRLASRMRVLLVGALGVCPRIARRPTGI